MSNDAALQPTSPEHIDPSLQNSLRYAVIEACLSSVMATLVGGAFLTGFALLLGAADGQIGLLAAIPAMLNLTQVFGSVFIRRFGSRRRLCLISIGVSRCLWLGILTMPFFFLGEGFSDVRVWLLMAGIALVSLFASAAGVAWLSWMTDLVPQHIRGRFNGRRSMYAAGAAMAAGIVGGRLIEVFGGRQDVTAFSKLFAVGVFFGFLALLAMSRIAEPPLPLPKKGESLFAELKRPLQDTRFLSFAAFIVAWSFAVSIASPFFSVYMIRGLNVPFSMIASLGIVSSLASIVGMRLWGGVMDRIGAKSLLLMCAAMQAAVPIGWLTVGSDNWLPLWFVHALGGFASAGSGLATTGLLVQVSPSGNTTPYFGMHAAFAGIAGASAPLLGGALGGMLAEMRIGLGPIHLEGLPILFALSASLRLLSLPLLLRVDPGRKLSAEEMLSLLRRLQSLAPVYGVNHVLGIGLSAAENLNGSVARAATVMERTVEKHVQKGWEALRAAREKADRIDRNIDKRLVQHENRLERLFDRIAAWLQKVSRWLNGP